MDINFRKFSLIVGLGNPGSKFEDTRHNIGAETLKNVMQKFNAIDPTLDKKCNALVSEAFFDNKKTFLIIPQYFMNDLGKSVAFFVKNTNIKSEQILVLHDDLDLKPGEIKFKESGSAGGHNGLRSIIAELGSDKFARLRIGIGRPFSEKPKTPKEEKIVSDYVLEKIPANDRKKIEKTLSNILYENSSSPTI